MIKDLESKLENNGVNSSRRDLKQIIRSFDFDIENMYKSNPKETQENNQLVTELQEQEEELSNLRQQIEVMQGDKMTQDRLIKSLKEENELY